MKVPLYTQKWKTPNYINIRQLQKGVHTLQTIDFKCIERVWNFVIIVISKAIGEMLALPVVGTWDVKR